MSEERDVTKTMDVKEFVAELRRFADALEAGESFEIEVEGETVVVPLKAVCSIEHERSEDGEAELEFQVTWAADTEVAEEDEDDAEDDEVSEKTLVGTFPLLPLT